MARKSKKSLSTDQVFGGANDMVYVEKGPEKDLSEALFGVLDQTKAIDSFEEALGVTKKKDIKPKEYLKSIMLDLDKEKDRKLLESLMNDPKYRIMQWKDNWSNLGRLRAFVVYSEVQVDDNKQL